MTDITIPPAALEAGAREVAEQLGDDWEDNIHTFCGDDFQMTPDGAKEACRTIARAACIAMLNAWPKAERIYRSADEKLFTIILSLPKEASDD